MAFQFNFDPLVLIDLGYRNHTGTGAQTDFAIGFEYLTKSSVKNGDTTDFVRVYVNGVEVFTWTLQFGGNTVRFNASPALNANIEFVRENFLNVPKVTWSSQSPINQRNLNQDQDWNRFVNEEILLRLAALTDDTDQLFADQTLNSLTDVTLTSPVGGQVLQFDVGTGQWVNATQGHFGEPDTNGTWRLIQVGSNLEVQRREGGVYVLKATFTP